MGKESLLLSVPNSLLLLPVSTKTLWNQHHHARWEKRKSFCSLISAGSWRVLGPCVVVHRILAFFLLSLYIGLRDYTVSLCEYGQLAFTNMYLSTFSCLKKEKKNRVKFIEVQQKVGLRWLGGLIGHFDNMTSTLVCLIVTFNGHPCNLRCHLKKFS